MNFLPFHEWYFDTKEELSNTSIYDGLLNYGLFGEKLPPCFTSNGLSEVVTELMGTLLLEADEDTLKTNLKKAAHDYIRYDAMRDTNVPRHLGIPHPEAYAVQVSAIAKHWKEIATHSNKPSPAVSRIHVRHLGGGKVFEMNYKGNERYRHQEEEINWMSGAKYVVHADVAACFSSIYSHAIPWALHGKTLAKTSNALALTGNLLDRCTQNLRDAQTNGLLIGPHSSNVISEIILTDIDCHLLKLGHIKVVRHIDDYEFFASTYEEAELFLRNLGFLLRNYEMSINEKKTRILSLPRPLTENWIRSLNSYTFSETGEVRFSQIRSFLDLALELTMQNGKSTPLNYAIKVLAGFQTPKNMGQRARRLYTQEAMNLALAFPYLAPLLDKHVFDIYPHVGLKSKIQDFCTRLIELGLKKLYPDTIAHALYYALKHEQKIKLSDNDLKSIITLDDCITNVLLLEYGIKNKRPKIVSAVKTHANNLKKSDGRERDKNWLLIYQVWDSADLNGNGQSFLAELKSKGFEFLSIPTSEFNETINSTQP